MKYCKYILLSLILTSCSPFSYDRVLRNESVLIEIFQFMKGYDNVSLDVESDDRLADKMRKLNIDFIIKNSEKKNNRYCGFVEESDSLLILIKKSSSIFQTEKRIIYDFAQTPREFGSDTISNASYIITQLSDRWYFSTVGFD